MAAQPQETPGEPFAGAPSAPWGPQHLQPVPDSPESGAAPTEPAKSAGAGVGREVPPEPSTELPEPAAEPEQDADEQGWADRVRAQLVSRLAGLDVVRHDRPSLAKVYRYARWNEQIPPAGPLRVAGLAYAVGVALPAYTVAYVVAWLVERPARAGIATVLITLAALFGPTRWVLTVLLFVPELVLELLTD